MCSSHVMFWAWFRGVDETHHLQLSDDWLQARGGKRMLGGTAKTPRRYSVRTAGSRRPNYAER